MREISTLEKEKEREREDKKRFILKLMLIKVNVNFYDVRLIINVMLRMNRTIFHIGIRDEIYNVFDKIFLQKNFIKMN